MPSPLVYELELQNPRVALEKCSASEFALHLEHVSLVRLYQTDDGSNLKCEPTGTTKVEVAQASSQKGLILLTTKQVSDRAVLVATAGIFETNSLAIRVPPTQAIVI